MQTLNSKKNEKKVKIIRAIIEQLKAENQEELMIIRLMDQITSKLWSSQIRECVDGKEQKY